MGAVVDAAEQSNAQTGAQQIAEMASRESARFWLAQMAKIEEFAPDEARWSLLRDALRKVARD